MFGLFKKDPLKLAKSKYETTLTKAMEAQRAGDIQLYAKLSAEAQIILEEINELESKKK